MINEIHLVKLITSIPYPIIAHTEKNISIQQIVFHPNDNLIYIQINGNWKKVSYKEVK